jgi:hypothetical protein
MFVLWFMERFVPLLRMNWDHELFLRKSGTGLPHSTTLARITACHSFREVVGCGSPMPLSQYFVVAFANQTHGSCRGLN